MRKINVTIRLSEKKTNEIDNYAEINNSTRTGVITKNIESIPTDVLIKFSQFIETFGEDALREKLKNSDEHQVQSQDPRIDRLSMKVTNLEALLAQATLHKQLSESTIDLNNYVHKNEVKRIEELSREKGYNDAIRYIFKNYIVILASLSKIETWKFIIKRRRFKGNPLFDQEILHDFIKNEKAWGRLSGLDQEIISDAVKKDWIEPLDALPLTS